MNARNAGSDYMSFTQLDYPATFASEGDPMKGGFPGDMNPYVHGINDTMDVDDKTGYFSLDVSNLHFLNTLKASC
jgi:leucyl aminopeptidase